MRYLKLFNEHSGYTEAMQTLEAPNVSHCVGENHVHYKPELPSVLPGNEEVWELYSSLVCDDERLKQDLRNVFSEYEVTVASYNNTVKQGNRTMYTDSGYRFRFFDNSNPNNIKNMKVDVFTSRVTTYEGMEYELSPVTNDCGMQVLPGGIDGTWTEFYEMIGPIGPEIS